MNFDEYWAIGIQANPLLGSSDVLRAIAEAAWNAGAREEREECAKVCESMIDPVDDEWRNKRPDEAAEFDASDAGKQACAAAIRARSNVDVTGARLRGSGGQQG